MVTLPCLTGQGSPSHNSGYFFEIIPSRRVKLVIAINVQHTSAYYATPSLVMWQ